MYAGHLIHHFFEWCSLPSLACTVLDISNSSDLKRGTAPLTQKLAIVLYLKIINTFLKNNHALRVSQRA